MSFQNNAGTIILDAVITDVGRKRLAQGNFIVSHFALGDDEVDYSLGSTTNGTFQLAENPPILEAFGGQTSNIQYGLLDLPRTDILYIPEIKVNNKVSNAVLKHAGRYYLSVNRETSKKVQSAIGSLRYLENGNLDTNVLLVETGIDTPISGTYAGLPSATGSLSTQESFLVNPGLMDKDIFVYCDTRFIEYVYNNSKDSYYKNDGAGNLYNNLQPLRRVEKTSLSAHEEYFQAFACSGILNQVYNHGQSRDLDLSMYKNVRGVVTALNFGLSPQVVNASTTAANNRFTVFGQTSQTVFGGSDTYDYIDTNIMIEGGATSRQLIVPLRIIRYRAT